MCNLNSKASLNPDAPTECFNCGKAIPSNTPIHPEAQVRLCEGCIVPQEEVTKSCEVCGTTTDLACYPIHRGKRSEYLCPTHTQARALNKAAHDHLAVLMEQTVRQWVLHWARTNISHEDIADALDLYFELRGSDPLEHRSMFVHAVLEGEPTYGI